MKEAELKQLTLSKAVSLIRRNGLSPVELVRATLERIQGLNEKMHAFITVPQNKLWSVQNWRSGRLLAVREA